MDREIMTVKGAELLQEELKKLKSVDRPEIITAIACLLYTSDAADE